MQDPNLPYDMNDIVTKVLDDHNFYQIMPDYARNISIGFGEYCYAC
jgi:propionyl-CoA carboxylase beta chain